MRSHALPTILSGLAVLLAAGATAVPIEDARIQLRIQEDDGSFLHFDADTLLQETVPRPEDPARATVAFAEIVGGAMRARLQDDAWVYSNVKTAVQDHYTLQGGSPGESVALTVRLEVDGQVSSTSFPGAYFAEARIGGGVSSGFDVSLLPSPFIPFGSQGQWTSGAVFPGETDDILVVAETVINAIVGDPFTLGYMMNVDIGGGDLLADYTNTATVSFDLPPGITLTSANGFGTSVPEPRMLLLAVTGAAGLLRFGRRRGREEV